MYKSIVGKFVLKFWPEFGASIDDLVHNHTYLQYRGINKVVSLIKLKYCRKLLEEHSGSF